LHSSTARLISVAPLRSGSAGPADFDVEVLGQSLSKRRVLAHPEAVASDVHEMAVMQDAIDQGCRHDFVAENRAPLLEPLFDVRTVEACS
jgi:hypothetical protein